MIVAIVPVLMAVAGALVYALSANPKVAELGRICAFAGFIGVAISYAGHVVSLGH